MAAEKRLDIEVRGKIAQFKGANFELVGGNSDYKVYFDFDDDWTEYRAKTAVFVFGDRTVEKPFDGNVCGGVAIEQSEHCLIGVYAGDIITTTPAFVSGIKISITDVAKAHEEPEKDVYDELMHLLNLYLNAVKGAAAGGRTGQVLKKKSDTDYDYEWADDEMRDLTNYYTIQQSHEQFATPQEVQEQIKNFNFDNAITVDKEYNPQSANAQSGIAVSEAFGQAVTQATLNAQGYTNQEVQKLLEYYPPEDGEDGFSPIISTYPISNGTQVVILDKQGEKYFYVYNGEQGEDGISPLVSVEKIEGGHKVIITDKDGEKSFNVFDGKKGEAGTGFTISKTYNSVYDMNVGFYVDDVPLNGFVLIDTGNTDDPDNAKLYIKREAGYAFLTDLSGAQGIKGESITVASIGESNEDGGENVLYFSDGNRLIVRNGRKGRDGQNGEDGKTPYIQDGYWYIGGSNTNVKAQGNDGTNGEDGYTPIKGVDYFDGKDGKDGVSPNIIVSATESGHNVTITDAEGTQSFEVKNGNDYILTPADKQEIIDEVLLEIPSGGGGGTGGGDIAVDQYYSPESRNAQSGRAVSQAVQEAKDYTDEEIEKALQNVPSSPDITVDQEYNPNSQNPQSGVAVAQAIEELRQEIPSGGGGSCDCTEEIADVQEQIDNIVIEGYERAKQEYYDITEKAERHDGAYITGTIGAQIEERQAEGWSYFKFDIPNEYREDAYETISASCASPIVVSGVVLAKKDGETIMRFARPTSESDVLRERNVTIHLPYLDAKTIYVNFNTEQNIGGKILRKNKSYFYKKSDFESVTSVETINGKTLRFFIGTNAEYEPLEDKDRLLAIITDDTTKEKLFSRIEALEQGGTTAPELNLKIDMPTIFSGQCAFPAEKGIYVISFENRTLTLFVPEPVGPGSLQYSTECIADDGVVRRLKFYNGILYVQKKNDGGDYETDVDYNGDFRSTKLASAHE